MQDKPGIRRILAQCLTCWALFSCGSSDGQAALAVLTQAPHCPSGSDALKIEGMIADGAIDDSRSDNINAGYENLTSGRFYTPFFDFSPLASNQLALTFDWPKSLLFGEASAISAGTMTLPATHPRAGAKYCVSAGQVGFVDGGAEDGALKFVITEVKAGSDCSGPALAVDLRGCDQ